MSLVGVSGGGVPGLAAEQGPVGDATLVGHERFIGRHRLVAGV
jgi:hypothetical protein